MRDDSAERCADDQDGDSSLRAESLQTRKLHEEIHDIGRAVTHVGQDSQKEKPEDDVNRERVSRRRP